MPEYRVRLELTAPIGTPLASGTVFGHLCWAWRDAYGKAALARWLQALPEAPLAVSDGFPAGFLPRPMLPSPVPPARRPGESRADFLGRLQESKARRKLPWLSCDAFKALRKSFGEDALLMRLAVEDPAPGKVALVRAAHNNIDRRTGTTPASGGLFFVEERWHDAEAAQFDVYVAGAVEAAALQGLFDAIGEAGYGRDASTGRGRFRAQVEAADADLFATGGNRLMSLSRGTLEPGMRDARYRLDAHFGKLGGAFAGGALSPFKTPIVLTRPGATFTPAGDGPFGALLRGVHPRHPDIVHNAWHLCLGYTAAEASS